MCVEKINWEGWNGKGRAGVEEERQEIRFKCLFPQNTAEENFQSRDACVILP